MKLVLTILISSIALFAMGMFFGIQKQNPTQEKQDPPPSGTMGRQSNSELMEGGFKNLLSSFNENESKIKLRGEERDRINFLFLGVGGEEHISGNYLTDTIILLTLIPSNGKAAAVSIPRDLMTRSPDGSYFTRINSLYAIAPGEKYADSQGEKYSEFPGPMGVEHTKKAVEEITGIGADYYAVLDLAGVEKIVDILGGINVRRIEDLTDRAFPDENYGYETYEINEGWRYLSGIEATKYIRTRHTAGGDFDRMLRQQEVALAIKKKMGGLRSLSSLPKLFSLYNELQSHFTTDLSFDELMRLMKLGENIDSKGVVFERIAADLPAGTVPDALLVTDQVLWGNQKASILKPRAGTENYEEIQERVAEIIGSMK